MRIIRFHKFYTRGAVNQETGGEKNYNYSILSKKAVLYPLERQPIYNHYVEKVLPVGVPPRCISKG